MAIFLEVGEKLPFHPMAMYDRLAYSFYETSYRGGPEYKNSADAGGSPTFIEHEQESPTGVSRRKRLATYRNYCKPVINKYNALVFTTPVTRDTNNAGFVDWSKNVDLNQTDLHTLMRAVTLEAQKLGRYYLLADTTKKNDFETAAQAQAANNRLYLTTVPPGAVVNWEEQNGILTGIIIGFRKNEYTYYTADMFVNFRVDDHQRILSIEEPQPHQFGRLPVVEVNCAEDNLSQIKDISEVNKIVFNLDSLLVEELFRNTFTQFFIMGVTPKDIGHQNLQGRKVITIQKPDATVSPLAADSGQAESIRESITIYEREIYRMAGLTVPDVVQNTESGRALKLKMNDAQQIAAQIADNAEKAENQVIDLYNVAYSQNIEHSDYPEDFQTEDLITELGMTLDILDSTLPSTFKKRQVIDLSKQIFPKMTQTEKKELLEELEGSSLQKA